jgi:hypothetical protein
MGAARGQAAGQREDRIHDQLSGPVVGDVAAPVGPRDRGSEGSRVAQDVRRVGPHPEGEHVRVLEHEQVVVGSPLGEAPLERVGLVVGHGAEPADPQHAAQSSAAQSRVVRISPTWRRYSET